MKKSHQGEKYEMRSGVNMASKRRRYQAERNWGSNSTSNSPEGETLLPPRAGLLKAYSRSEPIPTIGLRKVVCRKQRVKATGQSTSPTSTLRGPENGPAAGGEALTAVGEGHERLSEARMRKRASPVRGMRGGVKQGHTVRLLRHRQTKVAEETDKRDLVNAPHSYLYRNKPIARGMRV